MTTAATQEQNTDGLMAPANTTTTGGGGNYPITATPAAAPPASQAMQPTQPVQALQSPQTTTSQPTTQPATTTTAVPRPAPLTGPATVEGRLDNLLKSDSPYLKAAEDYALQSMNRRGLMQSSIAVGAAHDAAIRNALPIAQQDAQHEFQQQNTYQLHQYDTGKTDKSNQADQQKSYLSLAAAANDRYAQEFSAIQRSEMTAEQKTVAMEELKKWKVANDNWLNSTMATFSGSQINIGPFTGGDTGSAPPASGSSSAGNVTTPLSAAASLPYEKQAAALKSAGVTQATLDAAKANNWALFQEGKYLSSIRPAIIPDLGSWGRNTDMGNQFVRDLTVPAQPIYTAIPA